MPFRDALHCLLDELLKPVEFVRIIISRFIFWPLHCWGRRSSEALDHVNRRGMRTCGLHYLKPTCKPYITLIEFKALVQLEAVNKTSPAFWADRGHGLNDKPDASKTCKSDHVLISGAVRTSKLRNKHVQKKDIGHDKI